MLNNRQVKAFVVLCALMMGAHTQAYNYKFKNGLKETIKNVTMSAAWSGKNSQDNIAPGKTIEWGTGIYCLDGFEMTTARLGKIATKPGWSNIPTTGADLACRDLNITAQYDENGLIILLVE